MHYKTFTCLFLLLGIIGLLSLPAKAQRGEEIVIGTGTSATNLAPIYTYYNYSLTQQIYTADEIGNGGTITSISFNYAHDSEKEFDVDIYLKHTSLEGFSTINDYVSLEADDKFFTGKLNAKKGWVTITLDTPFEYDGTDNLMIAVNRKSVNWYSGDSWYYTSTSLNGKYSMWYAGDDNTAFNPLGSPIAKGVSNNRPNLKLEIETAAVSCAKPRNLTATDVSTHSAKLTWTAGADDQTQWEVYVTDSDTDVPDENTSTAELITSCDKTLTGLDRQTTYYAYVRAVCGDTDKSKWASTTFTTTREALEVNAQNPYSQDFETSNDWGFTNGTLTNQWCWGNAINHGGSKAMYISKDNGSTHEYAHSTSTVYASKLFNFSQGTYTFTFDWLANGESTYDYLRVALIPGDIAFEASTSLPSGLNATALPSTWIALDGGNKLNLKTNWQNQVAEASLSGTYTMVFLWRNDGSGGNQPPAAIDNISISLLTCPRPTNLTASNIGGRTATLTWTENGTATNWVLEYATTSDFTGATSVSVSGTASKELSGLMPETNYYVRVKAVLGDDESSWSDVKDFTTTATCQKPTLSYVSNSNTAHTGSVSWTGEAGHYELIYSTAYSFEPGDDGVTAINLDNVNTYTLQDLNPETTYRVKIRANCGEEDGYSAWSNQVSFTTTATCIKPSALTANDVTGFTATLTWTAGETGQNRWNVEYKKSTETEWQSIVVEDLTTCNLSDLTPVSIYNIRVQADCGEGDLSQWTTGTFTTACAEVSLPYTYGFEDNLNTTSPYSSSYPMPNCWNAIRYQYGSYPPYTYYPYVCSTTNNSNYGPRTGGKFLLLYKTSNLTNEIAVLPQIEANINEVQLRFWGRNGNGSSAYPEVLVGVMTDPTDASTFEQVKSVSVSTKEYAEYTVDFSSYTGNGNYIAIKLNPAYSSYSYTYFSIDDITIESTLSCLAPTTLEASEEDDHSAVLTWTPTSNETAWNLQYKKASNSEWEETITVEQATHTLTGLQRATTYEARVQAKCSDDEQSEWSQAISFTTDCGIWTIDATQNLSENFNAENFPPDCWQKVNFNEMGVTEGWHRNTNNTLDNQGAVTSDFKHETWLFLPHLHIDGEASLSFDHLFESSSANPVYANSSIMISTTPDIHVEDIKTEGFIEANFTQLWLADENHLPTSRVNEIISLSEYDGQEVYVAFRYEGTNSNSQWTWWIDNVKINTTTHQTVELTQGWNWFSTNMEVTLEDLQAALVEALPGTNIRIYSQNNGNTNYNGSVWRGTINPFEVNQLYLVDVSSDCEITLNGIAVNPSEHPVTISNGANWIAYPMMENMSINNTFAGFAVNGDKITSQNDGSSSYNGSTWRGGFSTLMPGKGYIYTSNETEDRQFCFPSNSKSTLNERSTTAQHETHWPDFNYHHYMFNVACVAYIQVDGQFITPNDNWADMEVAAFVGDECRGHQFMLDETSYGDLYPCVNIPVYYTNTNEEVSFKLYDHQSMTEYDICSSFVITGEPITILTSVFHDEIYMDPENAVYLSFSSAPQTVFTKEIIGYKDSKSGFYLISSPIETVSPESVTHMLDNTFDLYYFDQSQPLEWINYKSTAFDLIPGKGYLYANSQTDTLTFAGIPYQGDGVIELTRNDNATLAGWNLVGNPFATTAYIDREFYVMNSDGSAIIASDDNTVEPMEGFFVVAAIDGETMTISTTAPEPQGKGSSLIMDITRERGTVIDRAILRFGKECKLPKFMLNHNATKLYVPRDGEEYAVVSANDEIGEIPVDFKAAENGTYTLSVSTPFTSHLSLLTLIDHLTGANINLLETPNYSFEAHTTDYASRFKLVFAIDEKDNDFVFYDNGKLIVTTQNEAELQVIDMNGRVVSQSKVNGKKAIPINLTPGVYVIRINENQSTTSKKIVIE